MNVLFDARFLVRSTNMGCAPVQLLVHADEDCIVRASNRDGYRVEPKEIEVKRGSARVHAVLHISGGEPGWCTVHFDLGDSKDADVVLVERQP